MTGPSEPRPASSARPPGQPDGGLSGGPRGGLALIAGAILPGLGHLVLGRLRWGVLLLMPLVALALGAGALLLLSHRRVYLVGEALTPDGLALVAIVVAVVGLYRLAVFMATALLVARSHRTRSAGGVAWAALSILLALFVVAPHVVVEAYVVDLRDTEVAVAAPNGPGQGFGGLLPPASEEPSAEPGDATTAPGTGTAGPTPGAATTPEPTPVAPDWAADGRLNVLLIGADAGPGRWSLRTDTMILLSVDVATGRAALFGFPRNMVGAPVAASVAKLFPNGRYPGLLNSLYVYANAHPSQFPGGQTRGFQAIAGSISALSGVPIDGTAVVNLNGFVRLVDAVGGLTITIPEPLYDDHYPNPSGFGHVVVSFQAGRQHLNGTRALEYARSRHQDSDYGRMARQQAILLALRQSLNPCKIITKLPKLLKIARDDVWTSFSPSDLPALLELAVSVNSKHVTTTLFAPSAYPEVITTAEIKAIQKVVRGVFDHPDPAYPDPTPTPYPVPGQPTPDEGGICG